MNLFSKSLVIMSFGPRKSSKSRKMESHMTSVSSIRQTFRDVLLFEKLRPIYYKTEDEEELELPLELLENHRQKLCEKGLEFTKTVTKMESLLTRKELNRLKKKDLRKENVSKANRRKLKNQKILKLFDLFLTNILFRIILSFDFIQIYSKLYIVYSIKYSKKIFVYFISNIHFINYKHLKIF
jgi:hypothetical protein